MQQPALTVADSARLFLALLPDEKAKAALAMHRDQWQWPAHTALYAPQDWHVTLHFIGAVPRPRLDELRAALAVPLTPFELCLDRPELWPHGLAVLCPEVVPAALRQLHAELGQALLGLGLRTDARPYRPHLTLARHAAPARPPPARPLPDWRVRSYALMASTGQAAQRYQVLRRYGDAA
jgi:2'-5' RNA ligase